MGRAELGDMSLALDVPIPDPTPEQVRNARIALAEAALRLRFEADLPTVFDVAGLAA